MKNTRRNRRGFTLIELLIVVTIVGVVSMSAIPVISDHTRKARRAEAESMMGMFRSQARAAYAEVGSAPARLTRPVENGGSGVPANLLTGNYFLIDDNLGQITSGSMTSSTLYDPSLAALTAYEIKDGKQLADGDVGVMAFSWISGGAKVGWYKVSSKGGTDLGLGGSVELGTGSGRDAGPDPKESTNTTTSTSHIAPR